MAALNFMLDYMSDFPPPSVDNAVKEVADCFDTRDSLVTRSEIASLAREEIGRKNALNCSLAGWGVYGLKTTVQGVAELARALDAERTFTLHVWVGAKLRRTGEARVDVAQRVMSFVPANGLALKGAYAHFERGRPPRALAARPASLRGQRPPAPAPAPAAAAVPPPVAPRPVRRTTAPNSTGGALPPLPAHPPAPPATETPAVAAPAQPSAPPSRCPAISSAWNSVSSWGRSRRRADN